MSRSLIGPFIKLIAMAEIVALGREGYNSSHEWDKVGLFQSSTQHDAWSKFHFGKGTRAMMG